jgi:DnaJ-class molecular chaperone
MEVCYLCEGSGSVVSSEQNQKTPDWLDIEICPVCQGEGVIGDY